MYLLCDYRLPWTRCGWKKKTTTRIYHASLLFWHPLFVFLCADAAQKLRRGHTVSRPPSSHITRVDEESSASDSGGRSGSRHLLRPGSVGVSARLVETVDRGVGPTPHPLPPSVSDYPPFPNFLLPPYVDPRNGLLEPPYGKEGERNKEFTLLFLSVCVYVWLLFFFGGDITFTNISKLKKRLAGLFLVTNKQISSMIYFKMALPVYMFSTANPEMYTDFLQAWGTHILHTTLPM